MWRWVLVVATFAIFAAIAWWRFSAGRMLGGATILLFGFVATHWVSRKLGVTGSAPPQASGGDTPPMVSLVLLLREPRYLEGRVLAEILHSAWGLTFSVAEGDEKTDDSKETAGKPWIGGKNPIFMANTGTAMFVVHNHERSYFDDVANLAERVPELRQRTIITEHRAWLSIDAMGVEGEADIAAAYVKIARALAELADDKVLALFQPASNRLTPWEPSLETRLKSGEDLDELFAVNQSPVVQIAGDDPRMVAAVAEARQRWPEFVAAFQARQPDGNYAAKVPITRGGNTEFIWIEVIGLEPQYVHGKLANDPIDLGGLKLGDQVEAPIAELNDWTYRHRESDEPAGLFTVRVLTETYAQQQQRAKADS